MKLVLIFILNFLLINQAIASIHFDYSKDIQYQYPITEVDQEKLIYTADLMSFLDQTYRKKITTTHKKAEFSWDFRWEQNYPGAGANYYNGVFSIMLFGGHVRSYGSNFNFIAFTFCHELGHYLGGEPRQYIHDTINGDWSSAEGQADWFAVTQCLPLVYNHFKATNPKRLMIEYPEIVRPHCALSKNKELCQWLSSTGLHFVYYAHYYYARDEKIPDFNQKPLEAPSETLHSRYPSLQCRLENFKQGAICNDNQLQCQRPRCWFVPKK